MSRTYQFRQHIDLGEAALAAGTGITTSGTPPVNRALVTLYGGPAQIRFDGILPIDAANGQRISEDQIFELELRLADLQQVRIRAFSGSVKAQIDLFEQVV